METTILVIDDSQLILEAVSVMLTDAGYTVVTRDEPGDALELCEQVHFDMVLCDLCFDDWGKGRSFTRGLDTVMALCKRFPSKPVVAMSGFLRDEDLRALHAIGVTETLSKPFHMSELLSVVERAQEERIDSSSINRT